MLAPNAAVQRGRERHSGNDRNCASRPPCNGLFGVIHQKPHFLKSIWTTVTLSASTPKASQPYSYRSQRSTSRIAHWNRIEAVSAPTLPMWISIASR